MSKDVEKARQKALDALRRKMPDAVPDPDVDPDVEWGALSSGSMVLDIALGRGGFSRGRLTEVSGLEASGKTSVCLHTAAGVMRAGGHVVYLDPEEAMDRTYAKRLGVDFQDTAHVTYLTTPTFEDAMVAMSDLMQADYADLYIVDSVSALIPRAATEGRIEAAERPGLRAQQMSFWLPRMIHEMRKQKRVPAVILINQVRSVIEMDVYKARFAPKTTTMGGFAPKFYSSTRVEMTQERKGVIKREAEDPFEAGKDIKIPVASLHRARVTKNKVAAPFGEGPVWVRYDPVLDLWGIDNIQTLLDRAVKEGLVTKAAAGWHTLGDERVHGEEEAHAHLVKHPDLCASLAQQLGVDWSVYAPPVQRA